MANYDDFRKCVDIIYKGSIVEINCKLGLWEVSGQWDDADIHREALHYWRQYKDDGEYSNILGGESVIDKLVNKKREGL